MLSVVYADDAVIPAQDRGLAYGDGLFETIRMCGQKAVLRTHHLNRMLTDAEKLGIPVDPMALDREISNAAKRYVSAFGSDWVLKLILTRGAGGRGYRVPDSVQPQLIVSSSALPPEPDSQGVVARRAKTPLVVNPLLGGMKTLNRLEQVMASREFSGDEWEMIMSDLSGRLVEGTRTNLLVRTKSAWLTPPVESIAVSGVMRQYCLECLQDAGEQVLEQSLAPDFWLADDFLGLYLLNSVTGLVKVRSLDGVNLPVDGTLATICDPLKTLE